MLCPPSRIALAAALAHVQPKQGTASRHGDRMSLKQRLVSAFGWSVGIKLGFQLVTWAMTLMVIRVLAPTDYGLMAITQVFTNFMLGFANLGLGDALIQRAEMPRHLVCSVFGVLLVISFSLTAALIAAAHPIATWYGDPRLAPLIQVSSLGFIFNGLTTVPRMYLQKSLRIRPMFIMELSSGTIGAVTVAVFAFTGHGVWSLMMGFLAGNIARPLHPHRIARRHRAPASPSPPRCRTLAPPVGRAPHRRRHLRRRYAPPLPHQPRALRPALPVPHRSDGPPPGRPLQPPPRHGTPPLHRPHLLQPLSLATARLLPPTPATSPTSSAPTHSCAGPAPSPPPCSASTSSNALSSASAIALPYLGKTPSRNHRHQSNFPRLQRSVQA